MPEVGWEPTFDQKWVIVLLNSWISTNTCPILILKKVPGPPCTGKTFVPWNYMSNSPIQEVITSGLRAHFRKWAGSPLSHEKWVIVPWSSWISTNTDPIFILNRVPAPHNSGENSVP